MTPRWRGMPFASARRRARQNAQNKLRLNVGAADFVPLLQVRSMAKDYVAANLEAPVLDHLFPNMIEADKSASTWPYFRKQIDHPFRVDRRNPTVGFINRDEASILYANARMFKGRSGIEIGAWRGWSTAHLIAAGIAPLHVIEPLLADCGLAARVRASDPRRRRSLDDTFLFPKRALTRWSALAKQARDGLSLSSTATTTATPRPGTRWLARPISKLPQWSSFMTWCRPTCRRACERWRRKVGT